MSVEGKYIILPHKRKNAGFTVVFVTSYGSTKEVVLPDDTVLDKRAAKKLAKKLNRMRK